MKHIYLSISTCIILSFFYSCSNKEVLDKDYPYVLTEEVETISAEKYLLKAAISNKKQKFAVKDFGFIIFYTQPDNNEQDTIYLSISEKTSIDNFKTTLTIADYVPRTYNYRAYIKTDDFLVFGNKKTFKHEGDPSHPEIIDFNPKVAMDEDTIKLIGEKLDQNIENNHIYLSQLDSFTDEIEAEIISVEKDTVLFKLPLSPLHGDIKVFLSSGSYNRLNTELTLNIIGPEIDDVSPKEFFRGKKTLK